MDTIKIADDLQNALVLKNPLGYFRDITTFVFDVDGVLTDGKLTVNDSGETMRAYNAKDGYAIRRAIEEGYTVCIISGGRGGSLEHRMKKLGIRHIFAGIDEKRPVLKRFCETHGISPEQTLFMGDDLNDYEAMQKVGLPCCPADACAEIAAICHYISPIKGGDGCARDVIEKVLKLQGKWMNKYTVSS